MKLNKYIIPIFIFILFIGNASGAFNVYEDSTNYLKLTWTCESGVTCKAIFEKRYGGMPSWLGTDGFNELAHTSYYYVTDNHSIEDLKTSTGGYTDNSSYKIDGNRLRVNFESTLHNSSGMNNTMGTRINVTYTFYLGQSFVYMNSEFRNSSTDYNIDKIAYYVSYSNESIGYLNGTYNPIYSYFTFDNTADGLDYSHPNAAGNVSSNIIWFCSADGLCIFSGSLVMSKHSSNWWVITDGPTNNDYVQLAFNPNSQESTLNATINATYPVRLGPNDIHTIPMTFAYYINPVTLRSNVSQALDDIVVKDAGQRGIVTNNSYKSFINGFRDKNTTQWVGFTIEEWISSGYLNAFDYVGWFPHSSFLNGSGSSLATNYTVDQYLTAAQNYDTATQKQVTGQTYSRSYSNGGHLEIIEKVFKQYYYNASNDGYKVADQVHYNNGWSMIKSIYGTQATTEPITIENQFNITLIPYTNFADYNLRHINAFEIYNFEYSTDPVSSQEQYEKRSVESWNKYIMQSNRHVYAGISWSTFKPEYGMMPLGLWTYYSPMMYVNQTNLDSSELVDLLRNGSYFPTQKPFIDFSLNGIHHTDLIRTISSPPATLTGYVYACSTVPIDRVEVFKDGAYIKTYYSNSSTNETVIPISIEKPTNYIKVEVYDVLHDIPA